MGLSKRIKKYAVTSGEMKRYDANTSGHYGIPTEVLMERASLNVAKAVMDWRDSRAGHRVYSVLVMAGTGNNGGDGICAGRILKTYGYDVCVCMVGDEVKRSELCKLQSDIANKYGVGFIDWEKLCDMDVSRWDVIIDGLFGVGLSRDLNGKYADAVDWINTVKDAGKEDIYVPAVDIPSGIDADTGRVLGCAVRADITVTFNFAKIGHLMYPGCSHTGRLMITDAGITDDSRLDEEPGAFYYDCDSEAVLPVRRRDGHKGSNGRILVIAGSGRISGACVLAADALFNCGVGMVRVFTHKANAETVKTLLPEALADFYDDETDPEAVTKRLDIALKWSDAAVIGPGMGTDDSARHILNFVLEKYDKRLVIDADGLNMIATDDELRGLTSDYGRDNASDVNADNVDNSVTRLVEHRNKSLIITPHIAEFARLMRKSPAECKDNILKLPGELARKLNCVVVCKDARTVVATPDKDQVYINTSGNDGMATAGSGDVLSGILGYMVSQETDIFTAACKGVYLHGKAGDRAALVYGKRAMKASDISRCISCDNDQLLTAGPVSKGRDEK